VNRLQGKGERDGQEEEAGRGGRLFTLSGFEKTTMSNEFLVRVVNTLFAEYRLTC